MSIFDSDWGKRMGEDSVRRKFAEQVVTEIIKRDPTDAMSKEIKRIGDMVVLKWQERIYDGVIERVSKALIEKMADKLHIDVRIDPYG